MSNKIKNIKNRIIKALGGYTVGQYIAINDIAAQLLEERKKKTVLVRATVRMAKDQIFLDSAQDVVREELSRQFADYIIRNNDLMTIRSWEETETNCFVVSAEVGIERRAGQL